MGKEGIAGYQYFIPFQKLSLAVSLNFGLLGKDLLKEKQV